MDLLNFLRTQVRANRMANRRLHAAMASLSDADYRAPRSSFFPSLAATLDHILLVDLYYLDCLDGRADARDRALAHVERQTLSVLADDQARQDLRFMALLDQATAADLAREVRMPRSDHVQAEPMAHVVAHLLNHQVHHRGQAHAQLASSTVAPPQLDEFLMRSEAHLRRDDMQALGWSEATLFCAL
jgi:uncharacterized damage-inducible protein DinB